ncbi:uncharacterized protein PRCAT00001378001 [Priceomyces carsonii]|uniref:uncharacterized protein n=1 Tax=Priceomyces carsonii TaxID=28549 RepID=UPI002ED77BD4|nr:unnamed protein product [Priceomyces carsonii]
MIRRSRCIILLVSMILLHLVVFSLLDYDPLPSIKLNLFDWRKLMNVNFFDSDYKRFNKLVDNKFNLIFGNKEDLDRKKREQLYLLELRRHPEDEEINIPNEIASSENTATFEQFDPRFTLGIMMHHLSTLLASQKIEDISIPYFHWSDWADLSILDEFVKNNEKVTCKDYFDQSTSNKIRNRRQELFPAEEYCVDDFDIDKLLDNPNVDDYRKNILRIIQSQKSSTGWHVFGYGGRSKTNLKLLHGRSYLHDFMPPPMSIIFLLPSKEGKDKTFGVRSLEVKVNQNILDGKKKISGTDLLQTYVQNENNDPSSETSEFKKLNVRKELNRLVEIYEIQYPNPRKETAYSKELNHEMFIDSSERTLEELKLAESLSPRDLIYKESLEYSMNIRFPPKYFFEAKLLRKEPNPGLGSHYDWRFFNGIINFTDKLPPALFGLIRAWLSFTNEHDITTWIAHGSLLSWYWDGIEFPWDNDIDVQVPISDLHKLSRNYNQSVIVDMGGKDDGEIRYGRYFVDCGSFVSRRGKENGNNNIDARFIDVDSGLYIDITGLSVSETRAPVRYNQYLTGEYSRASVDQTIGEFGRNNFIQAYNCRNNHFARLSELSPLKLSFFEGQPAYIPSAFETLLINEYHEKGIESFRFKTHTFLPTLGTWVETDKLKPYLYQNSKIDSPNVPLIEPSEEDYMKILENNLDILVEFFITRNATQFHEVEMRRLSLLKSTRDLIFDEDGNIKVLFKDMRHDGFIYNQFKARQARQAKESPDPPNAATNSNEVAN